MRKYLIKSVLVVCVALVAIGLYVPFADSPAVFDDHNILSNMRVFDSALTPFSNHTRTFPRFTIGFVHVLSGGDVEWNRGLSAILFGAVVVALYFFLRRALSGVVGDNSRRLNVSLLACLWVALNPVAVYASGYLIQRTIVFATLFGIISAVLYLRAQQEERNVDLLSAALLAFLSVMSKEHAVLLPAATIALTPLVKSWSRQSLLRAGMYLLLTLPGAVWAIIHRGQEVLGASYEVFASDVVSQFASQEVLVSKSGLWAMSIGTQLLLFWKYLFLWLVPNPAWMSVDLRVDFPVLWANPMAYAGVVLSVVVLFCTVWVWVAPSRARAAWCVGFRVAIRRDSVCRGTVDGACAGAVCSLSQLPVDAGVCLAVLFVAGVGARMGSAAWRLGWAGVLGCRRGGGVGVVSAGAGSLAQFFQRGGLVAGCAGKTAAARRGRRRPDLLQPGW